MTSNLSSDFSGAFYFWNDIWHDKRKTALELETSKGPLHCTNFNEFWSATLNKKLSCCRGTVRVHCQLKSCKMLHKCSTDCMWKCLQPVTDLQGHSRSLQLLSFDSSLYYFLLVFHCKCISVLYRFRGINTYLPKNRRHVTLNTPIWGKWVSECVGFNVSLDT